MTDEEILTKVSLHAEGADISIIELCGGQFFCPPFGKLRDLVGREDLLTKSGCD